MARTTQSLQVRYGTFSCTVRGFDDSLQVMKDVALFFRELVDENPEFADTPPQDPEDFAARAALRLPDGGRGAVAGAGFVFTAASGDEADVPAGAAAIDRAIERLSAEAERQAAEDEPEATHDAAAESDAVPSDGEGDPDEASAPVDDADAGDAEVSPLDATFDPGIDETIEGDTADRVAADPIQTAERSGSQEHEAAGPEAVEEEPAERIALAERDGDEGEPAPFGASDLADERMDGAEDGDEWADGTAPVERDPERSFDVGHADMDDAPEAPVEAADEAVRGSEDAVEEHPEGAEEAAFEPQDTEPNPVDEDAASDGIDADAEHDSCEPDDEAGEAPLATAEGTQPDRADEASAPSADDGADLSLDRVFGDAFGEGEPDHAEDAHAPEMAASKEGMFPESDEAGFGAALASLLDDGETEHGVRTPGGHGQVIRFAAPEDEPSEEGQVSEPARDARPDANGMDDPQDGQDLFPEEVVEADAGIASAEPQGEGSTGGLTAELDAMFGTGPDAGQEEGDGTDLDEEAADGPSAGRWPHPLAVASAPDEAVDRLMHDADDRMVAAETEGGFNAIQRLRHAVMAAGPVPSHDPHDDPDPGDPADAVTAESDMTGRPDAQADHAVAPNAIEEAASDQEDGPLLLGEPAEADFRSSEEDEAAEQSWTAEGADVPAGFHADDQGDDQGDDPADAPDGAAGFEESEGTRSDGDQSPEEGPAPARHGEPAAEEPAPGAAAAEMDEAQDETQDDAPERDAPMVLVSSQRVDAPGPDRGTGPDAGDAAPRGGTAATLAAIWRARSLVAPDDRMMAAATLIAEASPDGVFTRSEVMELFGEASAGRTLPPEERMRAFGLLLRNGQIRRADRGVYALAHREAIPAE